MQQSKLSDLLPGSAGGRRLVELRGRDHLVKLGASGGRSTARRHGVEYMRQLGASGGRAKRRRQYMTPATIKSWDGVIYRRIPYWPHQPQRRRRRRPVFVRVELD